MKLRSLLLGSAVLVSALPLAFAGVKADPQPEAKAPESVVREPVWSARVSPAHLGMGLAGKLLESLGAPSPEHKSPIGLDPAGIDSLDIVFYEIPEDLEKIDFLVSARLNQKSKPAGEILEQLAKIGNGEAEDIAGHPAARYSADKNRKVWLVKQDDTHLLMSPVRSELEAALQKAPEQISGALPPGKPTEVLGVIVHLDQIPKQDLHSELLTQAKRLEFHIDSADDSLRLSGSAELKDKRAAKRVARMVEGVVAMMSPDTPSDKGPSLDERLQISAKDGTLIFDVSLNADEFQMLLDLLGGKSAFSVNGNFHVSATAKDKSSVKDDISFNLSSDGKDKDKPTAAETPQPAPAQPAPEPQAH